MTDFAREYGEGFYELCVEEKITEVVLSQLRTLDTAFREQPDFCRLLANHALPITERLSILDQTLRGQVEPYLLNFCKLLCERDLMHEFSGCVVVYTMHYHQDNNITVATVTTPTPLKENQRIQLTEKLQTMTGNRIELQEKIDPAVMGGILLEMDGKRWDNTVKNRLDTLRRALTER